MEKGNLRTPIVCVLGHVDHGKTTLLDAIRKTNLAGKEAGGITQSIGASVITTKEGKKITFIDTPGHAAFSKMRSRGANAADIVILVVSADDGVKPQTKEALQLIKESQVPFIVAVTKTDLPSANLEGAKGQLEKEGVLFEGRGGDTPVVAVSVKQSKGIDELLETISVFSDVHGTPLKAMAQPEAVVIESAKDKRGTVATVVVREGSLKVGNNIQAAGVNGKIKALFDDKGVSIKEVAAGFPALILGFSDIPPVGAKVVTGGGGQAILSEAKKWTGKVKEEEIPVIVRAKSTGSLEALVASLPGGVIVIDSGVGDVTESNVLAAKSSQALIFAFESKISSSVVKLAEAEGVKLERFEIIYELIARLDEILKKGVAEILGKAEVLASFPYENKKIAGCRVTEGKIAKSDTLILVRGEKEIGKVRAISLKKQKQEINEARTGEEFGVLLAPQLDFEIGDMLVSERR